MEEQVRKVQPIDGSIRQFCTFRIGGRWYGVDITDVKEVYHHISFTQIHHTSAHIRGYVNIRGHVYLILNLYLALGLNLETRSDSDWVILFKPGVGESFGIQVDKIDETVLVESSRIENNRTRSYSARTTGEPDRRKHDLSEGVCKLENGLLIVLNANRFLEAIKPI